MKTYAGIFAELTMNSETTAVSILIVLVTVYLALLKIYSLSYSGFIESIKKRNT